MDPKSLIDDLNDILLSEYYCFIEILGKGSFGIVIAAYSSQLDKIVAIKITPHFEQDIESYLLQECSHPNIVKLHSVLYANHYIYLVMEKLIGQTLDVILKQRNLDEIQIRYIIQQLLYALVFLHQKGIIHRDLKPQNIFICGNNQVKLIDLGLGYKIFYKGIIAHQVGTPYYIAPEMINNGEQTQAIDIFSLGIIYYQMMCNNKHPIWQDGLSKNDYYKIISQNITINYPQNLSEMAKDFIRNTICHNNLDRMTAEQCLKHPWMLGEQIKRYPVTNREIKMRYSFTQKFIIIVKTLKFIKFLEEYNQKELSYQNTQDSDEIQEMLLNDHNIIPPQIRTETHININHDKIKNTNRREMLKRTTSHQDMKIIKNRQQHKQILTNNYITQLYFRLSMPKVSSQKKRDFHLPNISAPQLKQLIFNVKQS